MLLKEFNWSKAFLWGVLGFVLSSLGTFMVGGGNLVIPFIIGIIFFVIFGGAKPVQKIKIKR